MTARLTIRTLVLVAVLGVLATVLAVHPSKTSKRTPYASALSRVAVSSAQAASCPLTKCGTHGNKLVCVKAATYTACYLTSSTTCNSQSCTLN